jgi:hypothetical protein
LTVCTAADTDRLCARSSAVVFAAAGFTGTMFAGAVLARVFIGVTGFWAIYFRLMVLSTC